ncbi:hypothetical protein P152DRAFT_139996 [Eremomyces bilateralis CBS 781.70]|uniref:Uncharacterized protein n=1 Tax=Eremomyces bilateralis CBS 781.70 TaxID=1392243 RepID=A0A6G1FW90_9PEZI|nr:uncharacterized protein P152DRAFT_139996 [Eremomyces bilateralis CBS 781.70]KAF1810107.1 hypothetical protein P152DRAFT_139996 [Eremomyces bilateralis CBS 781.70]
MVSWAFSFHAVGGKRSTTMPIPFMAYSLAGCASLLHLDDLDCLHTPAKVVFHGWRTRVCLPLLAVTAPGLSGVVDMS